MSMLKYPGQDIYDPMKKNLVPMALAVAKGEAIPPSWAKVMLREANDAESYFRGKKSELDLALIWQGGNWNTLRRIQEQFLAGLYSPATDENSRVITRYVPKDKNSVVRATGTERVIDGVVRVPVAVTQYKTPGGAWVNKSDGNWRTFNIPMIQVCEYSSEFRYGGNVHYSPDLRLFYINSSNPASDEAARSLACLVETTRAAELAVLLEMADVEAALAVNLTASATPTLIQIIERDDFGRHSKRKAAATLALRYQEVVEPQIEEYEARMKEEARQKSLAGQRKHEAKTVGPKLRDDAKQAALDAGKTLRNGWSWRVGMTMDGSHVVVFCTYDMAEVFRVPNPRTDLFEELKYYFITQNW